MDARLEDDVALALGRHAVLDRPEDVRAREPERVDVGAGEEADAERVVGGHGAPSVA